jgi:hypothetical protein
MDFLPLDDNRPAAVPGKVDPAAYGGTPDDATETTGVPFEWGAFHTAGGPDVPAPGMPAVPASHEVEDSVPTALSSDTLAMAEAGSQSPGAAGVFDAGRDSGASEPDDETAGHELDFLAEERPASDGQVPPLPREAPAQAAPIVSGKRQPAKPSGARMGTRQLAMVGGGVLAAGALIFTILGMRGAASPEPVVAPAPARRATTKAPAKAPAAARVTPAPAARAVKVDADAPRWTRVNDGRWVSPRGQTAAFELPATGRVHVWTRDVTPVLVVRCEKGNAEAFVYTQSAARMEPQDGDHTVEVSFDGASPASQRWPDSAEHDALFARNSLEFTRQLTRSRTLQFGFTPHNAEPVSATFVLDGLEPLLASSAKPCGWHRK